MDSLPESLDGLLRLVVRRILHVSMIGFWRFAKERGLSMTQMVILRHVHANTRGGCNVSFISEQMGLTNAAISQTLDRLVDQGLVSRTEDLQDRRSKRIQLTPEGEHLMAESMEAQQSWVTNLLVLLDDQEKELIRRSFELLAGRLEQVS